MTLGMIARADDGGLGSQTWEFWRHMQPDRTLVVLCDHNTRGTADRERYRGGMGEVRYCHVPDRRDAMWLATGIDKIWSAETFYSRHVVGAARARQTELYLHANPEMGYEASDVYLAATPYRLDLLPDGTQVLPFPVVTGEYQEAHGAGMVPTIHHTSSNAMLDRNGTQQLLDSLRYVRAECDVIITGGWTGNKPNAETVYGHRVTWIGHCHALYYWCWPPVSPGDIYVMPRRYGGLCLPVQEAQARELPVINLRSDPYLSPWSVPAYGGKKTRMKGGYVEVWSANAMELGSMIDRLLAEPAEYAAARDHSIKRAKGNSWDELKPVYDQLLR